MSLYGAIDKTKHFSEFADPLPTQEGVLDGATRKARCLSNLGLTALAAEINTLAGVVAGTASASKAVVLGASKDIAGLGNTAVTGQLTTTDGVASGTVKRVGGSAFVGVSATDTLLASAGASAHVDFAQTYSIPANTLRQGTILRIRGLVRVTDASGTDTLEVKVYLGGTTLMTTVAFDPDAADDFVAFEMDIVARAAPGAAASCYGAGSFVTEDGTTQVQTLVNMNPTNFATNGALIVKASAKWSATTANTACRLELFNVEII